MELKVHKTPLDGVLLIDPPTRFEDFRGEYVETYNEELYKKAGISAEFIQDDISVSTRHVLRGDGFVAVSGVESGEQVVIDGQVRLIPGSKVRIVS